MKKFIVLWCLLLLSVTNGMATDWQEEVILHAASSGPRDEKLPTPRMPSKSIHIYITDNEVTFDKFASDCILQIKNENGNTIYSQYITAGTKQCVVPPLSEGTYVIRFVFDNLMYCGTFTIV